jgi:hypothetical protein
MIWRAVSWMLSSNRCCIPVKKPVCLSTGGVQLFMLPAKIANLPRGANQHTAITATPQATAADMPQGAH